ncbi:hypothetical protein Cni_G08650 [Canna indica]|uniref:Uncharacterized protein n=1 Tax=Canna indica TaxID=4628 RepID=A0AAQ3Q702_9LILI|nr:hypothetical protein Cni_G08650 [Canna indica]
MSGEGKSELKNEKGAEEASLSFPTSRHGNLSRASSDDRLKDNLQNIRSSKNPAVLYYGASWYVGFKSFKCYLPMTDAVFYSFLLSYSPLPFHHLGDKHMIVSAGDGLLTAYIPPAVYIGSSPSAGSLHTHLRFYGVLNFRQKSPHLGGYGCGTDCRLAIALQNGV